MAYNRWCSPESARFLYYENQMTLKTRLKSRKPAIGSWITLAHPSIAEILARAGFSWIGVDLEHSSITIREAEELIRVIELCGCAPLVRLTSNDSDQIKRVMDAGAHGIIVPMVNSREDAERAVSAVRYPPKGTRGVALARAQGYGNSFKEYKKWLTKEAVVIAMIEHVDGVGNAEEILSVDGIDGYFMGPYDLSASLGIAGKISDARVQRAMKKVKAIAKKLRKPGGLHVVEPNPADLKKRLREGYSFIAYSLDTRMLDVSSRAGLRQLR